MIKPNLATTVEYRTALVNDHILRKFFKSAGNYAIYDGERFHNLVRHSVVKGVGKKRDLKACLKGAAAIAQEYELIS